MVCHRPGSASLPFTALPDDRIWPTSVNKAIVGGTPIQVFNEGQLERDFTYIDDIVTGVVAATTTPPLDLELLYRLLNPGNHQPVKLEDFIATLEGLLGIEAKKQLTGIQPGDVYRTAANIDAAKA